MLTKGKIIFVVVVVLFILPVMVFAQDNTILNNILKNGVLRVGTSGSQPPFTVKSRDGALIGYEIELSNILANAMGVKVKYIEKPFSQLLPTLEKGDIDIIMSGMTITPARNVKVAFSRPYIVSGKSILAKAKRMSTLDEMDEVNRPNITVVALEGTTSQRFVENRASDVKLVTTLDYDEAVKMVLEDKVDLMIADYPICILSIMRYPNAGLATLDEPLTIEPIGIALPPKEFLMHNMIDNYLRALDMVGVLNDLDQRWFEDGSWIVSIP